MKWWQTLWKQDPETDIYKDPDPGEVTIDNAYKTRWIWYHTILAFEIFLSKTTRSNLSSLSSSFLQISN